MKVRYTRRARADLEAIFRYIDERNPTAAWNVKAEIVRTCNNLTDLPYFGHMTDRRPDLFVVIVAAYPTYKIYYRIRADIVSIEHVRDARRKPIA